MDSRKDFLHFCLDHGVPELVEKVLSYLDYYDLLNASLVCKLWRKSVRHERTWKSQFKMIMREPTMRNLYLDMYGSLAPQSNNYLLACRDVIKEHEKLTLNWLNGAYHEEKEPSSLDVSKVISMDMNSNFVVAAQQGGKIVLHRRFSQLDDDEDQVTTHKKFHSETEFVIKSMLKEIACIQIDERNVFVCGGSGGVFEMWNASSKTMLRRLRNDTTDRIDLLKFSNCTLVTCSNAEVSTKTSVSLWNLNSDDPLQTRKEFFKSQSVIQIGLDTRLLVLLLKEGFTYEIVVRKLHTEAEAFSMFYHSRYYCGFEYRGGHIAAGSDDGKIRIWDAHSGECKRTLLRPSCDMGPIAIRLNSRFLVSNSREGMTIWNLKGALDEFLPWQTKLRCCFVQTSCIISRDDLLFLMDDLEIVKLGIPNRRADYAGLFARINFKP